MSYCRWSSNNWKCDLYCYEDAYGGYTTHVATRKIVGDVPKVPLSLILEGTSDEFVLATQKAREFLDKAEREPIGLPCDGKSFNDPDLPSFLNRLVGLKKMGYKFPDYVLEEVRAEKEERSNEGSYCPPSNTEGNPS